MKIRSVRRRALPALVAALALAAPAALLAQPITYTFRGTTTSSGSSQSYVLTLSGNASDVVDMSDLSAPSSAYLFSKALHGTVSLDGGPAQSLASMMSGYAFGVGALNGAPLVGDTPTTGVGFVAQNLGTGAYFGLFLPTGTTYDLASNFGPVAGDSYFIEGSFGVPNAAQFLTRDHTPVQLTSLTSFGPSTFSAQITATPEPASVALFATGLVAIGGVATRRRRRRV